MAKYNHHPDTRIALDDLDNRVQQCIEANELYLSSGHHDEMIEAQNTALRSVRTLIGQVRNTGHIRRATPVVPDDLESLVKTKWGNRPQLGLSEQMQLGRTEVD